MLSKYGCGTLSAVAGRSRTAGLLAVVLNDGVAFSPAAFASLLVTWFGGYASGYRVQPCQRGSFRFQVAHECIAKEIMLRDPWRSGFIAVAMSFPAMDSSVCREPPHAWVHARRRAGEANSLLPSILGPCPPLSAQPLFVSKPLPIPAMRAPVSRD